MGGAGMVEGGGVGRVGGSGEDRSARWRAPRSKARLRLHLGSRICQVIGLVQAKMSTQAGQVSCGEMGVFTRDT